MSKKDDDFSMSSGAAKLLGAYKDLDDEVEEEPIKEEAKPEPQPVQEEKKLPAAETYRLSVPISTTLNDELEDKLHRLKRMGVKKSKCDVVRDALELFNTGETLVCMSGRGHTFIVPAQPDAAKCKAFYCPICGQSVRRN